MAHMAAHGARGHGREREDVRKRTRGKEEMTRGRKETTRGKEDAGRKQKERRRDHGDLGI
jgi:hypothetical protein